MVSLPDFPTAAPLLFTRIVAIPDHPLARLTFSHPRRTCNKFPQLKRQHYTDDSVSLEAWPYPCIQPPMTSCAAAHAANGIADDKEDVTWEQGDRRAVCDSLWLGIQPTSSLREVQGAYA